MWSLMPPEAGIWGKDKYLHPMVYCGMWLIIHVLDIHQNPHMMYPKFIISMG